MSNMQPIPTFNLDKMFLRETPTDIQLQLRDQINRQFHFVAGELMDLVPPGAECTLMLRKLQEAHHWALEANKTRREEV